MRPTEWPETAQEPGRISRFRTGETGLSFNGNNFSELADQIPVATYAIDTGGRVTYYNRAAAELAGREPRIGCDKWCVSWRLYRPDGTPLPHDRCLMAVAFAELQDIRGAEAIVERPDGLRIWVEAYPTILYDKAGRVVGAVNVLVDITGRKKAAEAIAEAERQKSELLAQLAHELRNPLAAIRNSTDVLLRWTTARARKNVPSPLTIVNRQTSHLIRLVDDLLAVSRHAGAKIEIRKQRVNLAEVVRDAVDTARLRIAQGGHKLAVHVTPEPVELEADPTRLSQAFANLLINAAKFTQDGGAISLTAERRGDEAIVTVQDNGIGIGGDALPHLFHAFAHGSARPPHAQGGLGIGLALVKTIVESHGGTVAAHSDGPGHGSVFVVSLPIVPHQAC